MDWIDIEVQDSSQMQCQTCKEVIVDLRNVFAYGEWISKSRGRMQHVFFKEEHVPMEKVDLSPPYQVKDDALYLMYIQAIECHCCKTEIGTYFRTANIHNLFALKKYAFDLKKLKFKVKEEEIAIEVFADELDKSKESMTRKRCQQLLKNDIGTTAREISKAYAYLMQVSSELAVQMSRQRQKHIEQSCRK